MCIIYPPGIDPYSTVLVDTKIDEKTRSIIYKNNFNNKNLNTLMGFFINGEINKIETSYNSEFEKYSEKIRDVFEIHGLYNSKRFKLYSDCGFKTFKNKDFIVKSVHINYANCYLLKMIKEYNLNKKDTKIFNDTFLELVKNYKNTFYNNQYFLNLNLVLVKFKNSDKIFENTIKIIYNISPEKLIVIPTVHEVSTDYTYNVIGYADNIEDIYIEQFQKFIKENEKFYYIEKKNKNIHYIITKYDISETIKKELLEKAEGNQNIYSHLIIDYLKKDLFYDNSEYINGILFEGNIFYMYFNNFHSKYNYNFFLKVL